MANGLAQSGSVNLRMISKVRIQMSFTESIHFPFGLARCAYAILAMLFLLGLSPKVEAADCEISMDRPPAIHGQRGLTPIYVSFLGQDPISLIQRTFNATIQSDAANVRMPAHTLVALSLRGGIWTGRSQPAVLGNWVTQLMTKLETWLSNRTHMIQFCAIGMVLALVIIWWRKT